MAERFGAAEAKTRGAFLDEVRSRGLTPVGRWACGSCGNRFAFQDILIEEGEPLCPAGCGASGWWDLRPEQPGP